MVCGTQVTFFIMVQIFKIYVMFITYSVSICIFLELNIQERLSFEGKAAKPGKTVILRRTEFLFVAYV